MKIVIVLGIFIFAFSVSYCQNTLGPIIKVVDTDRRETDSVLNRNISTRGFNKFLAEKSIKYISKEGDVSLYKSFFIADINDGKFSLGRNFKIARRDDGIRGLITTTINSKAEDDFSSIFTKDEFSQEITGSFKLTLFSKGSVKFDGVSRNLWEGTNKLKVPAEQQIYMSRQRLRIREQVLSRYLSKAKLYEKDKLRLDSIAHKSIEREIESIRGRVRPDSLTSIAGRLMELSEKIKRNDSIDFYTALTEESLNSWYEEEIKAFDSEYAQNAVYLRWFNISIEQGITPASLTLYTNTFDSVGVKKFRGTNIDLSYTWFKDSHRWGIIFGNIGAGFSFHNSLRTNDLKEYERSKTTPITQPQNQFVTTESGKIFAGTYREEWTPKLTGQLVWLPNSKKDYLKDLFNTNWGVSFRVTKYLGKNLSELEYIVGFPITLEGEKKRLNLEPQIKWLDNKFQEVGFSVAVPFGNYIY